MNDSRFDVINENTGKRVLENVSREDVLKKLKITQWTFYAVLSEEKRLCRRIYRIIPHYPQKANLTYVADDFPERWRAMQRLFGLDPDEVAKKREEERLRDER